jgi:hypothetical protein
MNRYPSQFDEIQNQILECQRQGLPPLEDIGILQEWLMSDDWDHALAAWDDEAVMLDLAALANDCFTDQCMTQEGWLLATGQHLNAQRAGFARVWIQNAITSGAGEHSLSVHNCPVCHSNGDQLILGLRMEIQGHSPEPTWHGMFSDKETFYQYLKRLGYIFHRYISRINDQEILRSWKQQ